MGPFLLSFILYVLVRDFFNVVNPAFCHFFNLPNPLCRGSMGFFPLLFTGKKPQRILRARFLRGPPAPFSYFFFHPPGFWVDVELGFVLL